MINCGRAVGPAGVVFPVIVFLLGTFFITNLFLAMLVDSFLEGEDETKPAEVQPGAEEISKAESGRDKAYVRNTEMRVPIHDEDASDSDGTHIHTNADLSDGKIVSKKLVANSSTALYLIGSQTLNHEFFEVGITILVCVSCVSLALDNPLNDPSSVLSSRLYYIDLVITIIFTAEMLLKILVFGAFQKRGSAEAYFRDGLFLTRLPSFAYGLYYCSDHVKLYCTSRLGCPGFHRGSGVLALHLLDPGDEYWHVSRAAGLAAVENHPTHPRPASDRPFSGAGVAVGRRSRCDRADGLFHLRHILHELFLRPAQVSSLNRHHHLALMYLA